MAISQITMTDAGSATIANADTDVHIKCTVSGGDYDTMCEGGVIEEGA